MSTDDLRTLLDRLDPLADATRLIAAVEAVLDLHAPEALEVLASDCATEECDHWDECPTETFMVCRECYRVADETEPYFGERNVGPVAHPCPTVAAIHAALIGDNDE